MYAVISSPEHYLEIEKTINSLGNEIIYNYVDREVDLGQELIKISRLAIKHLILDISCVEQEEKIVNHLKRYRIKNEGTQIIIIAPNALPGNPVIHHLVTKIHICDIIAPRTDGAENAIILPFLVDAIEKPATYKKAIKWVIDDEDAILQIDSNSKEVKEGKTKIVKSIEERTKTVTVTKDRIIGTVTIAVIGTQNRVGVTHTAISIAKFLKNKGHKVALIENNDSGDFAEIKNSYEDIKEKKQSFIIDGIDFYPYSEKVTITDILDMENYNYAVIDMGQYKKADFNEFKRSNKRIVVSGTKMWELQGLRDFIGLNDALYKNVFYFTLSDKKDYELVKSNMDNLKCYLAPIQLNPFNYQKESAEIFKDILKDVLPEVNNESEKEGLFKKALSKVSSLKNK